MPVFVPGAVVRLRYNNAVLGTVVQVGPQVDQVMVEWQFDDGDPTRCSMLQLEVVG